MYNDNWNAFTPPMGFEPAAFSKKLIIKKSYYTRVYTVYPQLICFSSKINTFRLNTWQVEVTIEDGKAADFALDTQTLLNVYNFIA